MNFLINFKKKLRSFRDHPVVLSNLVAGLGALRRLRLFRGENLFMHVPYRGVVEVHVPDGKVFRIIARGGQIENRLYWDGAMGHEPASMFAWIKHAAAANVVLDIGANSGIFALAAAAAGAKQVHAFEPVERIHAIMRGNVEASGFDNVTAWLCAVGQSDGVAEIQDPGGDAPTSASLSAEFTNNHLGKTTPIGVKVVSIDSWADINGVRGVNLIKLDVEGFEEYALRGMVRLVMRDRPVILMEVLDDFESRIRSVVSEVFGPAYSWSKVDDGPGEHSRNVLLLPTALPR